MPVQREHLEEADVKMCETFQNNTYSLHFQLNSFQVPKEGRHAVVEEGSVSIGGKNQYEGRNESERCTDRSNRFYE